MPEKSLFWHIWIMLIIYIFIRWKKASIFKTSKCFFNVTTGRFKDILRTFKVFVTPMYEQLKNIRKTGFGKKSTHALKFAISSIFLITII